MKDAKVAVLGTAYPGALRWHAEQPQQGAGGEAAETSATTAVRIMVSMTDFCRQDSPPCVGGDCGVLVVAWPDASATRPAAIPRNVAARHDYVQQATHFRNGQFSQVWVLEPFFLRLAADGG